jgi:hypothetical protein
MHFNISAVVVFEAVFIMIQGLYLLESRTVSDMTTK